MMKIRIIEIQKWLCQIGNGMVELLFPTPEQCPVCGQEECYHGGLGKNCLSRIAFILPPICWRCGRPQRLIAVTRKNCLQCNENRYYFSVARSVAVYEGFLREYLTELKYRYRPDLGEALGILLVEWVKCHPEYQKFNLIIPIPIHWQKLTVRGYNQAELLANPLQKYLGIPIKCDIIVRDKITLSQNALNKEERFANIHEAFRVIDTKPIAGAKILLIDDIFTTGATVSEASRVLMRAGAQDVKVLTLAGGILDSEWLAT
ncbi:MAG TPA: ComF family protein [Firmicutes bacterium]|jgi:competence protein ComFC|nr:ComF family protein [Bacillota bacterium]